MAIRHYKDLTLDEKRSFIQLLLTECEARYYKCNCNLEYLYLGLFDTLRNMEIIVEWEEINSATVVLEREYKAWRGRIINAIAESNKQLRYMLDKS